MGGMCARTCKFMEKNKQFSTQPLVSGVND